MLLERESIEQDELEKSSQLQVPEFKNLKMIPSRDREIPDNIFEVRSSLKTFKIIFFL